MKFNIIILLICILSLTLAIEKVERRHRRHHRHHALEKRIKTSKTKIDCGSACDANCTPLQPTECDGLEKDGCKTAVNCKWLDSKC